MEKLIEKNNLMDYRVLLEKLKKAHDIYLVCNEDQKGRLIDSCGFLIDKLVTFGESKEFYTTLLIYGQDFLIDEFGDSDEKIFRVFKVNMIPQEIEDMQKAKEAGVLTFTRSGSRLILHRPQTIVKNDLASLWKGKKNRKEVEQLLISQVNNKIDK